MIDSQNHYFIDERDPLFGACLVLRGPWDQRYAELMQNENIRCLRLSRSVGWKGENLDFLHEVPTHTTGFQIYNWDVNDLTPLERRPNIEHLSFEVKLKKTLDLASFPKLRTLQCEFSNKLKNLENCERLEHLNITRYPDESLALLSSFSELETLHITSRKIKNLSGISDLKNLQKLDFAYCSNLTDLGGLNDLHKLNSLEIADCKAIENIPPLAQLKELRFLLLENVGTIPNLDFISGAESLEHLFIIGKTKISDLNEKVFDTLVNLKKRVVIGLE